MLFGLIPLVGLFSVFIKSQYIITAVIMWCDYKNQFYVRYVEGGGARCPLWFNNLIPQNYSLQMEVIYPVGY